VNEATAIANGLRCYEGVNGQPVWLNLSDAYLFLRQVSLSEMADLLAQFRNLQLRWVQQYMLTESQDRNQRGFPTIEGVRGNMIHKGIHEYLIFMYMNRGSVPQDAWSLLRHTTSTTCVFRHDIIYKADVELQRQFMRTIIGDSIAYFAPTLTIDYVDVFCFVDLEAMLARANDSENFIALVATRAEEERRTRSRTERSGMRTNSRAKSVIPDAFLFWLTQQGVLLRPVRPQVYRADCRGLDSIVMSPPVTELWNAVHATFSATRKRVLSTPPKGLRKKELAVIWERQLFSAFLITVSSTTARDGLDISEALFNDLFNSIDAQVGDRKIPDALSTIFRAMRDIAPATAPIPLVKSSRSKRSRLIDGFEWPNLTYSTETKSRFPDVFIGPYEPRDNVINFSAAFERSVPKLAIKNAYGFRSSVNTFLSWLVISNINAASVSELTREDINDGASVRTSKCFRAFLLGKGITDTSVNDILSKIATMFDIMIDELPERVPNPVVLRFDIVKTHAARGRTPRRALGRDMLDYMREFNARDNFALSKSLPSHYRTVFDRQTGLYAKIWFPGLARIIDLLLRLPLRGFQARYLDSGEGDEFVPDVTAPTFEMVRNSSALAQKGRRCGVLTAISGLHSETILGLYVNTNKTGIGREEGYEIPWCEEGLRNSLLEMIEWQKRWNPLAVPVKCVEKNRLPANPDVAAAIATSYPVFRDPDEPGGWPITRGLIYHYWDHLCAAVEDDLAAGNGGEVRVRLTDPVVQNKGSGKTWHRREARYDIHTLRVSGISALIEAGMPPDLVQQVAGHSTVVMTLYYNVVSASKLNEQLKAALLRTAVDMDSIDALREEDFDRVAEFLVNSHSGEDRLGLSMLRERIGYGTGEFDVMAHGICPGGQCSSGGPWDTAGHRPVPRSLACSLCRYRLTGPMFLPGLVLNANRLMHELRRKGQDIADLNRQLQSLSRHTKAANVLRGQVEGLYRETAVIAEEWAAEVQYVHLAKDMLGAYVNDKSQHPESSNDEARLPALITGMEALEAHAKLEAHSDFSLLQTLSEGAQSWFGFKPKAALADHREFLNEILSANDVDPFLLRLSGEDRDIAANLLGRAIMSVVPEERIDDLRTGAARLTDFPGMAEAMDALKEQALQPSSNACNRTLETRSQIEA
jgi:hypothetical protein